MKKVQDMLYREP